MEGALIGEIIGAFIPPQAGRRKRPTERDDETKSPKSAFSFQAHLSEITE
jgi:hypothetical protein